MEDFPGPFLVDNMEDEASKLYGAHPERLYIILDGQIVYQVSYFQEFNLSIEMCLHNTIFRAVQGPLTMFQMRSIVGWRSTLVRCLELHSGSFITSWQYLIKIVVQKFEDLRNKWRLLTNLYLHILSLSSDYHYKFQQGMKGRHWMVPFIWQSVSRKSQLNTSEWRGCKQVADGDWNNYME